MTDIGKMFMLLPEDHFTQTAYTSMLSAVENKDDVKLLELMIPTSLAINPNEESQMITTLIDYANYRGVPQDQLDELLIDLQGDIDKQTFLMKVAFIDDYVDYTSYGTDNSYTFDINSQAKTDSLLNYIQDSDIYTQESIDDLTQKINLIENLNFKKQPYTYSSRQFKANEIVTFELLKEGNPSPHTLLTKKANAMGVTSNVLLPELLSVDYNITASGLNYNSREFTDDVVYKNDMQARRENLIALISEQINTEIEAYKAFIQIKIK